MSFVLKDVVCSQCNNSRDLDLCRDPDLQVSCLLETASSAYPMLSRGILQRQGPSLRASACAAALDIASPFRATFLASLHAPTSLHISERAALCSMQD